jgi:hypothetical protein
VKKTRFSVSRSWPCSSRRSSDAGGGCNPPSGDFGADVQLQDENARLKKLVQVTGRRTQASRRTTLSPKLRTSSPRRIASPRQRDTKWTQ